MATNKEQREIEILFNAQQANASAKELDAAVALVSNQLRKMAQDDPGREKLKADFLELKGRAKAARDDINGLTRSEEELRAAAEKLNQENQQVILNGKKLSASFNEMDAAAKKLEAQLKDLSADDPGRKKMIQDYQELTDRIEAAKKEMGQAEEQSSLFKQALAFGGVTVGAEAVLEGIKELGAEILQTTKEVEGLRSSINTLTGATGAELDRLTTSVLAVSRTFDKDFNEVLQASNTLSKQMGVSQQEALRLVQQGFLAGADAGGDFLDQVKEYAPQFKAAGYEASQFIGHISQSATQGIFSDKGADVVKEFGLRIREQTKATSDAMQAAFGPEFTKEIFDGINSGSLTVQQALQRVGKEMDETKIPASQLQTVIADVYGGPGEDAGLEYLKSLKNVGKGVDEMIDKTNAYTQRQQRLLASQTDLAEAQNALSKELEGSGTVMDTLSNEAMTVLYTLLTSLAATWKEMVAPVKEVWASLLELGESMGWVSKEGTTAKDVGQMLGNVISWILTPTKLLWGVLADVTKATVAWAKSSDTARGYLQLMTSPIRALYDLLTNGPAYFQGFSAAAESSFGAIGRAWERIKNRDFSGAKDEFANIGKNAGDAYRQAFDQAVAKKASTAATVAGGGQEPEADKRAQGGDGITETDRQKASEKAQKDREKERKQKLADQKKADQEQLDATKKWVKEEGDLLNYRNSLQTQLGERAISDAEARRAQERQKIFADADKKAAKLTGLELDYSEQLQLIAQDRDLALRELQAKFDADEEKRRQDAIEQKIRLNAAEEEETLARLQLKLANGTLDQQAYDDAVFQAKQAAKDRELALLKQKNSEETAEYKKLNAEKIKEQAAHDKKAKDSTQDVAAFKKKMGDVDKFLNSDNVKFLEESLGKQTILYKAFKVARKAEAIANLGVALQEEIQAYWAKAATLGPILGPIYGVGMTGLAVVRSGLSAAKIAGFAKGGATGEGMQVQRPSAGNMWELFGNATGMRIGANGKLTDETGHQVAGIVHQNEYVIPEWMRQDPQVLQVEQWLEARRLRGYAQGGVTGEGGRQAAGDELPGAATGRANQEQMDQRLLLVLESLDQRLQQVEQWPTSLEVVLDLLGLDRDLEKLKKVKSRGSISPK